jgi:hypothetical protein
VRLDFKVLLWILEKETRENNFGLARRFIHSGPEVFLIEGLPLIAIPSKQTSTYRQPTSADKAVTDAM